MKPIPGLILLLVIFQTALGQPVQPPLRGAPTKMAPYDSVAVAKAQEASRLSRLARQAESSGDYVRALEMWKSVEKVRPGDFAAYGGIRRCLVGLSRFDEALEFLDRSKGIAERGKLGLDPTSISADRVEVLFAAGRDDQAEAEIEKELKAHSDYPNIYRDFANILYARRRADEAVDLLRRGRKACKDPTLFAREIAQFAEARMDWPLAVEEYLLYLTESPDNISFITGALGDIIREPGGDTLVTRSLRRKRATLNPEQAEAFLELEAGLLFRSADFQGAFEAYRQLDSGKSGEGEIMLTLARQFGEEGAFDYALRAYNEFLSKGTPGPGYYRALIGKARICRQLGMIDSARVTCQAVLAPGSTPDAAIEAHYRLGEIALEQERDTRKARGYFESALKLYRPGQGVVGFSIEDVQCALAMTYQMEGRLDLAEKELQKAVKTAGAKAAAAPQLRLELARLIFRRGNLEAARNEVNALIIADPGSEAGNNGVELLSLLDGLKDSPEALKALGQAELLYLFEKKDESLRLLDSLARNGAGDRIKEEALWRLSEQEKKEGNFHESVNRLEQIIILDNKALKVDLAYFQAAETYRNQLANPARAVVLYNVLLDKFPESPLADHTRKALKELTNPHL
jgi:tetratricopeptide (TPR) repeat protein